MTSTTTAAGRPQRETPDGAALAPALEDLRRRLAVIYASAQLLQRRLHAGEVPDRQRLRLRLDAIERSARLMEGRLRELERQAWPRR